MPIGIGLIGICDIGAVVAGIGHAIAVAIERARVAAVTGAGVLRGWSVGRILGPRVTATRSETRAERHVNGTTQPCSHRREH